MYPASSSSSSSWRRALLVIGAFVLLGLGDEASSECFLSEPIKLHPEVLLEQVKNTEAGTYTVRVTYTGGNAWVALGINLMGENHMTPSTAVIGRVNEDEDGTGSETSAVSVLKYIVSSALENGAGVLPVEDEHQSDVTDATFVQTETESILTFTDKLQDSYRTVSDESMWLYAVGLPDNQWAGIHQVHGGFLLPLVDNCTTSSSDTSTETSTTATNANTNTNTNTNSNTGLELQENASEATRPLWTAHEWIMTIAWAIVAPCAVGASMLRHYIAKINIVPWYPLHFYLNMLCIVMTIVGFAVAVAATQQEGKPHFQSSSSRTSDVHRKAGLALFILVLLQSVGGYLRPSVTSSTSKSDDKDDNADNQQPKEQDQAHGSDDEGGTSSDFRPPTITNTTTTTSTSAPSTASSPPTMLRTLWQTQHRLTGIALLGLAWYNCHSGFQLLSDKYPDEEEEEHIILFWSITGIIAGIVVVLAYGIRTV